MRIDKEVASRPRRSLLVDGVEVIVMCWGNGAWPCYIFVDYQHAVVESGTKISKEKLEESGKVVEKILNVCEEAGFKVSRVSWGPFQLLVDRGSWEGLPDLKKTEEVYCPSFLTTNEHKKLLEEAILAELTARLCPEN